MGNLFQCIQKVIKPTSSKAVTQEGLYSVDAVQLNPSVEGTLANQVSNCFQSVSDGKNAVATALTNQGVATAGNAEFGVMATNVGLVATNKYNAGYADGRASGIQRPAQMNITYTASDIYHYYANGGVTTFYVPGYAYAYVTGTNVDKVIFAVNGAQIGTGATYWGGSPNAWYPVTVHLNNGGGQHSAISVTLVLYG